MPRRGSAASGGSRGDSVLKVGERQAQSRFDHCVVNRGHTENPQYFGNQSFRLDSAEFPLDEVVDGRDGGRSQQSFGLTRFDRGPNIRASLRMGLPVQQNVQDDVRIHQEPLHRWLSARRYLAARCRL